MRINHLPTMGLFEARVLYGSIPILESGEGPRWRFDYHGKRVNDPKPDILLLGAYRHPNTGNDLVGGINIHYLSDDQKDELARALPRIMQAGDLQQRYWTGRQILPEIFLNFYRTYDSKFIRGVRKDVMYPKYGFMKTTQQWLKKKLGNIFKSRQQRQKEAEPKYPQDLENMDDRLDRVVMQLQQQQQREEPQPETPEIQAARSNFQKIMRAKTLRDIEKREDEPLNQAQADLERQEQEPQQPIDPRQAEAEFEQEKEENREELENPENEIDLGESIAYYSPRLKRYIIEAPMNGDSKWLFRELMSLRDEIAKATQIVYDDWKQNEEGYSDFVGYGGICGEISAAIGDVLDTRGISWTEGGHEGDDHSYVIAYTDMESYAVDIPYSVYEQGGGYSWSKIDDIQITPNDVDIIEVQRPDWIDPPIDESSEYDDLEDVDIFGKIPITPLQLGNFIISGETTIPEPGSIVEMDLVVNNGKHEYPIYNITGEDAWEIRKLIKIEYPELYDRYWGPWSSSWRHHYSEMIDFALSDIILDREEL